MFVPMFVACGSILILIVSSDAIINETMDGFLFTLPDQPASNPVTIHEAQQWCIRNNNTLPEIYNSQIQDIVERFLNWKSFGNWNFWINGMRTTLPLWHWVNGQSIKAINILQQTNSGYDVGYLQLDQSGYYSIYAAQSTDEKVGYICKDTSHCNSGFSYNSRCYKIYIAGSPLTWYEARNECLKGEGDLASFDFINDDQTLKNLTRIWISSSYSSTPLWIGTTRQQSIWQGSKTEIEYTNWDSGHPNTQPSCIYLTSLHQWKWGATDCSNKQLSICLREIGSSTTTASSTSSASSQSNKLSSEMSTSSGRTTPTHSYSEFSNSFKNFTSSEPNLDTVALGVGIGVGVGGFLIIIIVVVVIVLVIKKRRSRSPGNSQSQKRLKTPDVLPEETNYAKVQQNANNIQMKVDDPKIIYSEIHPTNN